MEQETDLDNIRFVCPLTDYHPILFLSMSLNSIEKLYYMYRFRINCEERL